MLQWAISNLGVDKYGNILIEGTAENPTVDCDQDTFSTLFVSVTVPPSYAVLSALTLATAGGWQQHFDSWKARGLIN